MFAILGVGWAELVVLAVLGLGVVVVVIVVVALTSKGRSQRGPNLQEEVMDLRADNADLRAENRRLREDLEHLNDPPDAGIAARPPV